MTNVKPVFVAPHGRLRTNFIHHGALAEYNLIVPAGKRWYVIGGQMQRDQNATGKCSLYDSADNLIFDMAYEAAGTSWVMIPEEAGTSAGAAPRNAGLPIIADAGMYFKYLWGAAQTTPATSLLVLEVDI